MHSMFSKILVSILNRTLTVCGQKTKEKLSEAQTGFVDFAKVFDSVDRKTLTRELTTCGLYGKNKYYHPELISMLTQNCVSEMEIFSLIAIPVQRLWFESVTLVSLSTRLALELIPFNSQKYSFTQILMNCSCQCMLILLLALLTQIDVLVNRSIKVYHLLYGGQTSGRVGTYCHIGASRELNNGTSKKNRVSSRYFPYMQTLTSSQYTS